MGEAVRTNLKRDNTRRLAGFFVFTLSLALASSGVFLSFLSYRWYINGHDSGSARMILTGLGLALVFAGLIFTSGLGFFRLIRKKGVRVWTSAGILVSVSAAAAMVLLASL